MAANKAVVNVTASVLPDNIKKHVVGTAVYNLNDGTGDMDKWLYYLASVATGSGDILNGTPSFLVPEGDSTANVAATDNVYFVILHHTGYKGDGVTKTTAELYFNFVASTAGASAGNLTLKPGEVWWGRLNDEDIGDLHGAASLDTINVAIYAVVDDQ